MDDKRAGTSLRLWMDENGFTNSTLAKRMGVSYELIYKISCGVHPPSDGFKWRFAQEFGIKTARRLFTGEAEHVPA